MNLNNPEATQQALNILRSGDTFQWYVIPLLVIVLYIYANEYEKGNYRVIAGGLALYMVHWFVEIGNALIQHCLRSCSVDSTFRISLCNNGGSRNRNQFDVLYRRSGCLQANAERPLAENSGNQ